MGGGIKKWIPIAMAAALVIALPLLAPASGLSKAHCKKESRAKRCKKKKPPAGGGVSAPQPIAGPAPNVPPPPPPPVLRVEIQWPDDTDVDVHVWNAAGTQHASTKSPNGIPGVSFSPDVTSGGGTEKVFSTSSTQTLVVGVCNNGSDANRTPDTGPLADVKAIAHEGQFNRQISGILVKPNEGSYAITTPQGPELPPGNPDAYGWCYPKRAEMTWDNGADLDLHVFDSAGNHASPATPYGIPDAYMTADVTANTASEDNYEEFFDRDFESNRTFYYYFCVKATNGVDPNSFYDVDLFNYEPPFIKKVSAFQGSIHAGDESYMTSSPGSAPYPPPFTLPNYCP